MNMHVRIPVQTSLHVHDRAFSSRAPIDDSVKMAPTPDREAMQGSTYKAWSFLEVHV